MIECLILGDSIAVGIQQHRIECASYAHVGWTSEKWNRTYLNKDLSAQVVVISLGSNDWSEKVTKYELMRLREKVRADLVFWILPAIKPGIRTWSCQLQMYPRIVFILRRLDTRNLREGCDEKDGNTLRQGMRD
jgi:hypothetical protein